MESKPVEQNKIGKEKDRVRFSSQTCSDFSDVQFAVVLMFLCFLYFALYILVIVYRGDSSRFLSVVSNFRTARFAVAYSLLSTSPVSGRV